MNGGDGKVLLWRRNHSHLTALKNLPIYGNSGKVPRRGNGFWRADSDLVNLNPLAVRTAAFIEPIRACSDHLGRMGPPFRHDQRFEIAALAPDDQLVERAQIGLGGGDEGVGIRALRTDRAALLGEPDRDLGLGVGAL